MMILLRKNVDSPMCKELETTVIGFDGFRSFMLVFFGIRKTTKSL